MSLAAIIAYTGCIKETSKSKLLEAPLLTAGSIILITGAGGAYGGMIRLSGVGEVLAQISGKLDISLIFVSWFLTAFIRITGFSYRCYDNWCQPNFCNNWRWK